TTSTTTTEPVEETVDVYFSSGDGSDCSQVEGFARPLPDGADALEFAFAELVAGPTAADTDAGAGSFFSSQTADAIALITLTDGLVVVDFIDLRPLIPNASTSCGSEALLGQLNATAFQFGDVDRTRYRIEGSCDEFGNWLQRECFDTDRDGNQLDVSTNERASGSGCTPPPGDTLPDGRWFGFVDEADADRLSFDLACWFTGTAAAAAAAEDGEESPPPNDFHIRNESDRLRTLPVDVGTAVDWLPNPGDPASVEKVAYDVWLAQQPGRDPTPGVWLDIEDGHIAGIEEQYVP
ncbi:MAG: GerMN domain-containing protein, partial [Acidimicrobiia bacterium]|nr:GerMN domain-containing protein [Acidimicrobiia bacterium]